MYDIIIIGLGAAGAVYARELTEAGFRVLGLEYGPHYQDHMNDFVENEMGMWPLTWDNSNYVTEGGGFTGAPNLGNAVGGGTLAWAGVALRMFDRDFNALSTYGQVSGANLQDWPVGLSELEPYYDRAEVDMGVSGAITPWDTPTRTQPPNPAFGYYPSAEKLKVGMQHLNIQHAPGPVARNSQPYDGRDSCLHCGFCRSGCRPDAKYQSDKVLVERAVQTGLLTLKSNAYVVKIHTSVGGSKATGVSYIDKSDNTVHTEQAKLVITANNPIEIPRLLLNSANAAHPNGIGNSSDQIGRNFFAHLSMIGVGVVNECISASIGYNMANIMSLDFCAPEENSEYVGGYSIQSLNGAGAGVMAADPYAGLHGVALKDALRAYNYSLFMVAFCEGLPVEDNRISLEAGNFDDYGVVRAKVHYAFHANDNAVFTAARTKLQDILGASGATSVSISSLPFESHPMGGMRMGADPSNSATDQYGRVHGVNNLFVGGAALFPTGSSVNPTLTIHALALRSCDYIKDNWSALVS